MTNNQVREIKGITVRELVASLMTANPNDVVVIKINRKPKKGVIEVTTPYANIASLYAGFDWDSGKLYLIPDRELEKLD